MYDADQQRPHHGVKGGAAKPAVESAHRCFLMAVRRRIVGLAGMGMDVVTVRVVMHGGLVLVPSGSRWPIEAGPQVAQSQHNKHHANCEFHRKSYAWRQRDSEENENGPYEKDGDRVPNAPGGADDGGASGLLLPGNNGTDRDD